MYYCWYCRYESPTCTLLVQGYDHQLPHQLLTLPQTERSTSGSTETSTELPPTPTKGETELAVTRCMCVEPNERMDTTSEGGPAQIVNIRERFQKRSARGAGAEPRIAMD